MVLDTLVPGVNPISVDFVFVHGLDPLADPKTTWGNKKFRWPQDGLPWYRGSPHPSIRVLSFGYTPDLTKFFTVGLVNTAHRFLSEMDNNRRGAGDDKRPVIFVAHSVGGLVVKQALVSSWENSNSNGDPKLATIASAAIGAVFLGTPHRFTTQPGWDQTAKNLTDAFGLSTPLVPAGGIAPGLNALVTLESTFNTEIVKNIEIFSFYEGMQTTLPGGPDYVVGQTQSTTGTIGEHQNELQKEHRQMPIFADDRDSDYDLVAGAIFDILDDYENGRGPANKIGSPGPRQPDPRFADFQNGLGPPLNTGAPRQIVQTTLFPTGNICGDPNCGRTRICAADFNRRVKPMGYPGV